MPAKGSRTGKIVKCRICGKEIYKTQTMLKRRPTGNHYCSQSCSIIGRHMDAYEIRQCEICRKDFECAKISKQRFCSDDCQIAWQRTIRKRPSTYAQTEVICDWCGKPHLKRRYMLKNEHHFCSYECSRSWLTQVYCQSEEFKEFKRKDNARMLAAGLMPKTNSKPQQILDIILDNAGIHYIREYNVDFYAVDTYLSDYELFIEVMGDYWHCSPLKYESVKYDCQKKSIRRDKAKHTFIKNKYNTEILYLWENDLLNNRELCLEIIRKFISKNGVLDNYHSFNYELIDNSLQLKHNVIVAFQERPNTIEITA